jgi:hypothetical protein
VKAKKFNSAPGDRVVKIYGSFLHPGIVDNYGNRLSLLQLATIYTVSQKNPFCTLNAILKYKRNVKPWNTIYGMP